MALGHWLKDYIGPHSGGSGGGGTEPLIVRYDHTEVSGRIYTHYFDKTWQEVADALTNFTPVYIHGFDANSAEYIENPLFVGNINGAYQEDETFGAGWTDLTLQADSADDALYYKYEGHA